MDNNRNISFLSSYNVSGKNPDELIRDLDLDVPREWVEEGITVLAEANRVTGTDLVLFLDSKWAEIEPEDEE